MSGGFSLSKRYHCNLKYHRQNKARNLRNRSERSALRTKARRVLEAIAAGDKAAAEAAYSRFTAALDKGVKHNLVHRNAAARKKSRYAKKIAAVAAV